MGRYPDFGTLLSFCVLQETYDARPDGVEWWVKFIKQHAAKASVILAGHDDRNHECGGERKARQVSTEVICGLCWAVHT